jgi:large subunit ribosomal protein L6
MSRIGRKPIPIESGVDVAVQDGTIVVKGKHGELSFSWHPRMAVAYNSDAREVCVTRPDDHRQNRALHGLTRSLINNMVVGVTTPFEKRLEIVGVGYNATIQDNILRLQVGYANTVELPIPDIVSCETTDPTHVVLKSVDKHAVGQFAANIRAVRPPEPYKGKGIRYQDEHVRRKAGKAFASGG